jgi:fused signal recognition particle receptor
MNSSSALMFKSLFGSKPADSPDAPKAPSLLERLKAGVQKTRTGLMEKIDDAVHGRKAIDAAVLEELEYALITADLGAKTTAEILERIRERVSRQQVGDAAELKKLIREHLLSVLRSADREMPEVATPPTVVMVVGVNGAGKTTSIGKLTHRLQKDGRTVMMCAADTFRAAAIEQLEVWAQRTGCEFIHQQAGSDPSAVLFDALQSAKARKTDVLIVDTAGRLHTKANLMAELEKMRRTAQRVIPDAPHEVLLVIEATTGQNGLEQARKFTETAEVTGIILTKLDGTAKGGVVVAISRELSVPIRYVGVGEQLDDLLPFDPEQFIASLFD